MKSVTIFLRKWLIVFLATLTLSACGETATELQLAQQAMAIESHEECHLCGMIINGFPGPKGQLYERGNKDNLKFCSTRDMFAYLLDPEHRHAIQTIYVHDMAVTPWDHSDEQTYIDARKAWYVVGHSRKAAMGPTLASFSDNQVAIVFAEQYGGKIYGFEDINQQLLLNMK
ncbi:MAG: nitrous oxide reductase accessory protein NosL [Piscirickettsiaceae bacterium]|nr:nitrous oxide reductase accessory protein NosL [Piscirickettsiaceae bacterium]